MAIQNKLHSIPVYICYDILFCILLKDASKPKQLQQVNALIQDIGVTSKESTSMALLPSYERALDRNIIVKGQWQAIGLMLDIL